MSGSTTEPRAMRRSTPTSRGGARDLVDRILPVLVVVLIVAGVAVALGTSSATPASAPATTAPRSAVDQTDKPVLYPPAMSFAEATAQGRADSIDWGKRCDTRIGKLALPLFPQQPCYRPWAGGDNGGATTPGVTATEIKVVIYERQAHDPVLSFIYGQIGNDDTPDQDFRTFQAFSDMFSHYYETYGRKVRLIRYDATGTINDPVAATADAESIANDIRPFAVIGGPQLTNAFADTLAANKVLCISCTPGQADEWYDARAPYVWDFQKSLDQDQQLLAEYVGKRLAGNRAEYAGDAAMHDRKRVFGYVHGTASDTAKVLEQRLVDDLRTHYGVEFADIETYQSPTDLPRIGRDIITRMKEHGVTTVLFAGDPLAPQALTKTATEQNWFPEWVLTGSPLVESATFGRTYDPRQWAHAFGPSNLFARTKPTVAGPIYLHEWYYGTPPAAIHTSPLILPTLQVLYGPLPGAGTDLTPEHFRDVLFHQPVAPSTPITPRVSFGNRGVFLHTDYTAMDDQAEVWWDPTATGPDEINRDGAGLWRYVDGGVRYLPGHWPKGEPHLFDRAGTVTVLDQPPAAAVIPTDYTPLR